MGFQGVSGALQGISKGSRDVSWSFMGSQRCFLGFQRRSMKFRDVLVCSSEISEVSWAFLGFQGRSREFQWYFRVFEGSSMGFQRRFRMFQCVLDIRWSQERSRSVPGGFKAFFEIQGRVRVF